MFTPQRRKLIKRMMTVFLLALFVGVGALLCADTAYAQAGDKDLAQQEGIGALFDRKTDPNDPRLAKPWQKWLGWGSFGVMIIVVKYL